MYPGYWIKPHRSQGKITLKFDGNTNEVSNAK